MRQTGFLLAALALQLLARAPEMPDPLGLVLLPAVVLAGWAALTPAAAGPWVGLALGLGWDILLAAPVIGPGAVAWSVAALTLGQTARLVADRSPGAWGLFAVVGAVTVHAVTWLCWLPLGLAPSPHPLASATSAGLTGLVAMLVAVVLVLDLPERWRRWQRRRLR